jgi:adhesin transport system outer membrane protein
MKVSPLFIFSFISAGLAISVNVSAQTLEESVQLTIDENPEIQTAKSERLAVEQEIGQAKSSYFPSVDLGAGYGYEHSNNPTTRRGNPDGKKRNVDYDRTELSASLRQMLFDGFSTPSEVNRHKARTDARAYTVFGQSEITALESVEAYLNVLRRQNLLQLAKENLAIHERTNDQIALRAESGIGKKADAQQSLGRVALAETNVKSEEGNLFDAETAFQRVIGVLPKDLEPAPDPIDSISENLDAAIEEAIENHPILKSANSDIESAFAQHKTAASPYYPRVDLEAGYSWNNNLDGIPGKNEDLTAMVKMQWNVFKGGKDKARRSETAHLINQAKNIRDNTYRQVVESMRLSWVAYQTVKNQMVFFKRHSDASVKTSKAYQEQFNIGQRSLLDLLDSANEMFQAKSAYVNSLYDQQFAMYRILTSKGTLNQFLDVKLPKEASPLKNTN